MDTFAPFTIMHAVTLLWCAAVTCIVVWIGLARRNRGSELAFRHALGWFGLAFFVVHQIFWLTPPRLSPADSLPLHICDLNGIIAPLALLTAKRPLRSLLYFWGIGLSLQGLIQPVITDGPATMRYWFFFSSHVLIVGYAVYDLLVARFRPSFRDFRFALIASLVYVIAILPLDIVTGWNYGYVGNATPKNPTVIDALGPWPMRVFMLVGIAVTGFAVMWLPWEIVRIRRARRELVERSDDIDNREPTISS